MLSAAWEALLADSARTFNGGLCSFPLPTTVPADERPNTEYERVFFDAKSSHTSTPPQRCSAGWIIPGSDSLCNPIFVAHSLLSAIWLVRETLPPNTLSNDAWACLAHAADKLASLGKVYHLYRHRKRKRNASLCYGLLPQRLLHQNTPLQP